MHVRVLKGWMSVTIISSVCHMTWSRLTNIVTDVGRGVGEDSVDELTNDLLVNYEVSLEGRRNTKLTPASLI